MKSKNQNLIVIPKGIFNTEDPIKKKKEELKKKREEVFKRMEENKDVSIERTGNVTPQSNTGDNIQIPKGILANDNFFWYNRDMELYSGEVEVMRKRFPYFKMDKLDDGRLCWEGDIKPGLIGDNSYHLMLVYDNNHPNNSTYGGSVKVYLVNPSIEKLESELDVVLPHTLKDGGSNRYLCTSRPEDFIATETESMSAASCLAWAVKWIALYEGYVAGDVTYEKFAGHTY